MSSLPTTKTKGDAMNKCMPSIFVCHQKVTTLWNQLCWFYENYFCTKFSGGPPMGWRSLYAWCPPNACLHIFPADYNKWLWDDLLKFVYAMRMSAAVTSPLQNSAWTPEVSLTPCPSCSLQGVNQSIFLTSDYWTTVSEYYFIFLWHCIVSFPLFQLHFAKLV